MRVELRACWANSGHQVGGGLPLAPSPSLGPMKQFLTYLIRTSSAYPHIAS